MALYDKAFYEKRHENTLHSAKRILTLVSNIIPQLNSAIDLGCGIGTWLSVTKELGANKVKGYDGDWVPREYLVIPEDSFVSYDLSKKIIDEERFDLAISLEVAEHLPESHSETFVETLCKFSDFVLFSAAIPGQGGEGHINLQWMNYWIEKYKKFNYVPMEIIRKRIWDDEDIPHWYRQNIMFFVKEDRLSDLKFEYELCDLLPPEVYSLTIRRLSRPGIKASMRNFRTAIIRKLFKKNKGL